MLRKLRKSEVSGDCPILHASQSPGMLRIIKYCLGSCIVNHTL